MRVVLRAGFDRFSGYGNDAVDLAINMQRLGADVLPMPMSLLPGLPREFLKMLEQDPRGRKDVAMTFAPPYDIRPWEFVKMAEKAVGYSMWERTPILPDEFDGHGWSDDDALGWGSAPGQDAWKGLAHMFVTCPMNKAAFRNVDATVPLSVVPCGIEEKDWPFQRRDAQEQMQFLMIGMLGGRKVPFVLLDAWRDLKRERPDFDARLRLHTLARGLHPKIVDVYPDVEISQHPLDRPGLIRLYHESDVLVSVSRGEGNNKPAMEFMATGGTVIASDWSGHQNWLHPDITYGLPGALEPSIGQPNAEDFAVDVEALKKALLAAWENRADTVRRGERAAVWIRETLTWPVVVDRMLKTLERL